MLQVSNLNKSYGVQTILKDISFNIQGNDRVGLVGANGCGKSTLLDILTGKLPADSGIVALEKGKILGYLPQKTHLEGEISIQNYLENCIPGLIEAQQIIEESTERLKIGDHEALAAYGQAANQYEALGGYQFESKAQAILAGLGLPYLGLDRPMSQLSGGEAMRVHLAGLLLAEPHILLLDEPTNHLDIEALEWLEGFLKTYQGAVLLVSHDRVFLDAIVDRVLEIDEDTHTLREYAGNYSGYARQKELELQKLVAAWQDQQEEIKRLRTDAQRTAEQARHSELATRDSTLRRYAKKVAKKAKAKEKRLERYLDSDERVEKPEEKWRLRVNFDEGAHQSQLVLAARSLGHAYQSGWLFQDLDLNIQQGDRIALIGPNGCGKSTLLKCLLGEIQPSAGTVRIGNSTKIGYMPQQQENLPPGKTPIEIIQAIAPMNQSEVHHFLHYFLFEQEQARLPNHCLSFGQRARLLLAKLVASGANCLVLDEPVNHLDIPSREQFERALEMFKGTVVVVAHDRAFIQRTADIIWKLNDGTLSVSYMKNILQ